MNSILKKLILKQEVTDLDLDEALREELVDICESEHSSCGYGCPVFKVNYGEIPKNKDEWNCKCFKSGIEMKKFILERITLKELLELI